ncbi:MAG: Tol-Pal system beta propeller repeat protein TolB [Acidiferrobacterales bacterium]
MARRLLYLLSILYMGLWGTNSQAVLTIEITQSADVGIPIAVVPFGLEGQVKPPQDVARIVQMDLARSGRFSTIAQADFLSTPHLSSDVVFKDWRLIKAEALVIGTIRQLSSGQFEVTFRLYDVFREKQLAGVRYSVDVDTLRTVAHQISDIVYEKLTGERGAFNTRIAYVTREDTKSGLIFKLQVADSDGHSPNTVLKSKEPIMSPAWSPDGERLAYVSFEGRRSKIYIQGVAEQDRQLIADFQGINGAPAWSPDGRRLALTLSKDGNPEIYILDLDTRRLKRLTRNRVIDTEPAWSPDGREIVFTSDRAGRPQVYRMKASGRTIERLTFEGTSNARPSYSADGEMLTMVTEFQGRYHIATLRLKDKILQVLSETPLDESPSFAPNGRMILYATAVGGRGVLASVSSDGRVRQLYKLEEGDVREPAWSPYNRKLAFKE